MDSPIKMAGREWAADLFREAITNCETEEQMLNQIEFCSAAGVHLLGTILFNATKNMGKASRFTAIQNMKELIEEELEFMDSEPTDFISPQGLEEEDEDEEDKILH